MTLCLYKLMIHEAVCNGSSQYEYEEGILRAALIEPNDAPSILWSWNGHSISAENAHAWICGADIPMPV